MKLTNKANLYLLLVAAIWGVTFPLVHNAMAVVNPFLFVYIRFFFGALLLMPLAWSSLKTISPRLLTGCIILGLLNSGGYATQTIGLQTIPGARAAFITGLCVVIIPLLAPLFKLGRPTFIDIICSLICLYGLYILTGADIQKIMPGDYWVLLCAVLFALSITYLQYLYAHGKNFKALAFYQMAFTVPLPFLFSWGSNYHALLNLHAIIAVVFCTVFATTLAFYIQTKYQQHTSAPKAAIIYSMEPVFASIFGFFINGEILTRSTIMGGVLILFSLMLPAFIALGKNAFKK